MKMHNAMMRAGLLFAMALIALAVVPTASANIPYREIKPAQDDVLVSDCGFPVLVHFDGPEIDTTFLDKNGRVRLLGVFPGHTVTLTNPETGTSITVGAAGSFHLTLEPDGSGSAMATGQGIWPGNPVTGEPGIWYQSGRVSTSWDAQGNTTSLDSSGTLVDFCPQLAP